MTHAGQDSTKRGINNWTWPIIAFEKIRYCWISVIFINSEHNYVQMWLTFLSLVKWRLAAHRDGTTVIRQVRAPYMHRLCGLRYVFYCSIEAVSKDGGQISIRSPIHMTFGEKLRTNFRNYESNYNFKIRGTVIVKYVTFYMKYIV